MIRRFLIVLLLIPASALPQTVVLLLFGGTLPFTTAGGLNTFMSSRYWEVGFSGSVVIRYKLTRWFDVSSSVEHDLFPFTEFTPYTEVFPPRIISSSGSPAQLTRFGLNLRVLHDTENKKPKLFLLVGGGYAIERYGHMDVTLGSLDGVPLLTSTTTFPPEYYWSVWFSFGAVFQFSRYLAFEPTVAFRHRLDDWSIVRRKAYGCFTLSLVYTLLE
jgi:hypothetical protein